MSEEAKNEAVEEVKQEEVKDEAENVTQMPQAPGADGQIPQGAMLNLSDLQNIRVLMDRVNTKGVAEAQVVVTICAKIDAIVRAEAVAQKAAQDKAAKENGTGK